jgi:hypothetical protein
MRRVGCQWRKARGLTGEFNEPEDSERSRALTDRWQGKWVECEPIGYLLRSGHSDRWVRFHSLPESKRHAESPAEYDEILGRHRIVLSELLAGSPVESLIVIANDWGSRDLASGWSRNHLPGAWPWRIVRGDEPGLGLHYLWVKTDLSAPALDDLLVAAANDRGRFLVADSDLNWLYCPHDGGVDIIAPTTSERDELRDRHPDWLSQHRSGL